MAAGPKKERFYELLPANREMLKYPNPDSQDLGTHALGSPLLGRLNFCRFLLRRFLLLQAGVRSAGKLVLELFDPSRRVDVL